MDNEHASHIIVIIPLLSPWQNFLKFEFWMTFSVLSMLFSWLCSYVDLFNVNVTQNRALILQSGVHTMHIDISSWQGVLYAHSHIIDCNCSVNLNIISICPYIYIGIYRFDLCWTSICYEDNHYTGKTSTFPMSHAT